MLKVLVSCMCVPVPDCKSFSCIVYFRRL